MTNPGFGPPTPEGVCRWLAAMDDPTDEVGMAERQTVTLTKIIDEARAALETREAS